MGRLLLILWSISSMLACPFQCMGCSTRQSDGISMAVAEKHCDCCPHESESSDGPSRPTTDDDCCDCICDGALLVGQKSVGLDDVSSAFSATSFDAVSIAGSSFDGLSQSRDAVAASAKPGRALRLVIHSLQF